MWKNCGAGGGKSIKASGGLTLNGRDSPLRGVHAPQEKGGPGVSPEHLGIFGVNRKRFKGFELHFPLKIAFVTENFLKTYPYSNVLKVILVH